MEACVDLLEDVEIRAEFINKFRDFLVSLGIVMPRPEALPYLRDAKILGFIAKVAANLYRDEQLNLLGVEIKVRQLIDQYIAAQGIDPRIPPIEITDVGFEEHVRKRRSSRTRASEMLHALRHHIHIRINEDPEFFNTMSEKLEKILQTLKDNWDELEKALIQFIREEVARGRQPDIPGLDPKLQAPFFGVLKQRLDTELGTAVDSASPEFAALVQLTVDLVERIREEIRRVDSGGTTLAEEAWKRGYTILFDAGELTVRSSSMCRTFESWPHGSWTWPGIATGGLCNEQLPNC